MGFQRIKIDEGKRGILIGYDTEEKMIWVQTWYKEVSISLQDFKERLNIDWSEAKPKEEEANAATD
jgi:hypothetical protein